MLAGEVEINPNEIQGQQGQGQGSTTPAPSTSPAQTPSKDQPIEIDPNDIETPRDKVRRIASEYGVDPNLAERLANQESGFNQHAISDKGAIGLMQLLPATAQRLGVNPYDLEENIRGGVRYLKEHLDEFKDTRKALAAYNAGPQAVRDYNGIPPYQETQDYVRAIMGSHVDNEVEINPDEIQTPSQSQPIEINPNDIVPSPSPSTPSLGNINLSDISKYLAKHPELKTSSLNQQGANAAQLALLNQVNQSLVDFQGKQDRLNQLQARKNRQTIAKFAPIPTGGIAALNAPPAPLSPDEENELQGLQNERAKLIADQQAKLQAQRPQDLQSVDNAPNGSPRMAAIIAFTQKHGPLTDDERKQLGLPNDYLSQLSVNLGAGALGFGGNLLAGGARLIGANRATQALQNAGQTISGFEAAGGNQNVPGAIAHSVGALAPAVAGSLLLGPEAGAVGEGLYWGGTGALERYGEGGTPEEAIMSGASNLLPIAGARVIGHLAVGGPLAQFTQRTLGNATFNGLFAAAQGGDAKAISTAAIMGGFMGLGGHENRIEIDDPTIKSMASNPDIQASVANVLQSPTPESIGDLKARLEGNGLDEGKAQQFVENLNGMAFGEENGPPATIEGEPQSLRIFQHERFGRVIEAKDQSNVPSGKIKVIDSNGDEHIVQPPHDNQLLIRQGTISANELDQLNQPNQLSEGDQNATTTGNGQGNNGLQFQGIGPGTDLSANGGEIRPEESQRPAGRNSLENSGQEQGPPIENGVENARGEILNPSTGQPIGDEGRVTGIKNAQVDLEREQRGLTPLEPTLRKTWGETLDNAKARVDNGDLQGIRTLAKQWLADGRPLTDEENAALDYDRMRIQNEHDSLSKAMQDSINNGDLNRAADIKLQLAKLEDDLNNNDLLARRSGTEWGRSGSFRKALIKEDYSLANLQQQYRISNKLKGTDPIPDDVRTQLSNLSKQVDDLTNEIAKRDELASTAQARKTIDAIDRQEKLSSRKINRAQRKADLSQEWEGLKDDFNKALRTGTRMAIPGAIPPEVIPVLLKMARNRIAAGFNSVDGLVDQVYSAVKDKLEGVSLRDVRDAISGYGKIHELSSDAIEVQLRELKRQARMISSIEDAQKGEAPQRSGLQRDKDSSKVKELKRQLNEEMKKNGIEIEKKPRSIEERIQTILDTTKTRLRNEIDNLDRLIAGHEKSTPEIKAKYDDETIALQAARDMLKRQLDDPTAANKADVRNRLNEAEEKLRNKDFSRPEPINPPKSIYDDAETTKLRQQLKNVQDQLSQGRNEPKVIENLNDRILDLKRRIREKDFSKASIANKEVSPEVAQLRSERDVLLKEYNALRPKSPLTDEQRLEMAKKSTQRSIDEYQRRIDQKDFQRAQTNSPSDPELEALRVKRDSLKDEYQKLNESRPEFAAEQQQRNLKAYKTRVKNRIAELEKMKADNSFYKNDKGQLTLTKPKASLILDPEAQKLQNQLGNVKDQVQKIINKANYENRPTSQKTLDGFTKARRMIVLSSLQALEKISTAGMWRQAIAPIEELIGGVESKLPLLSKIAAQAPREGGFSIRGEVEAISQLWKKATYSDMIQALQTGKGSLDVLYGKTGMLPPEYIDYFSRIHKALKTGAMRNEFFRSFQKRLEFAADKGMDINDPTIQQTIGAMAYIDANRAIFMGDNLITNMWQSAIQRAQNAGVEGSGQRLAGRTLAAGMKAVLPIVKVPTNYVAETSSYAIGGVKGTAALLHGIFSKGLNDLPPEQADYIMRNFKKQTIGAGLFTLGYLGAAGIKGGGYYISGEKRDPNDLHPSEVSIFGHVIPHVLLHHPAIELLQMGATVRRTQALEQVKEDAAMGREFKAHTLSSAEKAEASVAAHSNGVGTGLYNAIKGAGEQTPFLGEVMRDAEAFKTAQGLSSKAGQTVGSFFIPPDVQRAAKMMDIPPGQAKSLMDYTKEELGIKPVEGIKRKPHGFIENIQQGVPYWRTGIPESPQ